MKQISHQNSQTFQGGNICKLNGDRTCQAVSNKRTAPLPNVRNNYIKEMAMQHKMDMIKFEMHKNLPKYTQSLSSKWLLNAQGPSNEKLTLRIICSKRNGLIKVDIINIIG